MVGSPVASRCRPPCNTTTPGQHPSSLVRGPEGFLDPKRVAGRARLRGLGDGVRGTEIWALSHPGPLQASPPPPIRCSGP